jgi:hypothetical protein
MPQPNRYTNGGPDAWTAEQIDDALTALIAMAGNATGAVKYLKSAGKRAPASQTLLNWARTVHWERYEELREKVAGARENTLANDYLDAAAYATEGARLATKKAIERLNAGKDEDPARTAANLTTVAQKSTDKRLSLQGRPTQIIENRNVEELFRSLAAMGVLKLPEAVDEPAQIETEASS